MSDRSTLAGVWAGLSQDERLDARTYAEIERRDPGFIRRAIRTRLASGRPATRAWLMNRIVDRLARLG